MRRAMAAVLLVLALAVFSPRVACADVVYEPFGPSDAFGVPVALIVVVIALALLALVLILRRGRR